jgi:prolipoprotein diacylglyceryltransferase
MKLLDRIKELLDRVAGTHIRIFERDWPAFRVFGCAGFITAVLLTTGLAIRLRLSVSVLSVMIAAAIATFFAVVMATKLITAEERIIYYHHEIAVMAVAAIVAAGLHQPVLPYLDVTILSLGVFLAFGRIGCLLVGCCHGRPHDWGVCYRQEHADAGFPEYYVGVRLFPVQLIESLGVLLIAAIGTALLWRGAPAGAAVAFYSVSYGAGRFCIEFLRGDAERSFVWGFSQPQWISVLLMSGTAAAEWSGALPFRLWHSAAAAGVSAAMIAVAIHRHLQSSGKHELLHPRHVREVARNVGLVSRLSAESADPRVSRTSLGIQISAGAMRTAGGFVRHYSLSCAGGMTEEKARILAKLIVKLTRTGHPGTLLEGNHQVFHLLTEG